LIEMFEDVYKEMQGSMLLITNYCLTIHLFV
jgi:hypothetical protein